ncbi:MAG: S41 family peptidase [Cyanobacteria bacterium]|nr:S41 family peptidase [Cyanobacteriota bacterium]
MFERLCALLFRLYPLEFRRTYSRDAWQLIRDRARVERRPHLRARLLCDLVTDICATSWRGWRAKPALATAAEMRDGAPRFTFIEPKPLHPQWRAAGMMTSMVMFASFTLLFQAREFAEGPAQLTAGSAGAASSDSGGDDDDAAPAAVDISALRREIVESVADHLKKRYYDPDQGSRLGNAILTYAKNGAYDHLGVGNDLAHRLTNHIYDAGRTLGIPPGVAVADVVFLEDLLRKGPPVRSFTNCSVIRAETVRRNIGYLKLNAFAPPHLCKDTIARTMAAVNDADAVIIDLRDNGGGIGETALQVSSYLFDRPVFMFDPRPNSQVPSHTTPIGVSRLTDKPIYLLTSSTSQSAAEYFAYNLAMHKRVTIVGERTAGAQHSGAFREINQHFGIAIQEVPPPPSPFPVKGWEMIGVEPDVSVPADMALRTATRLANSR